MAAKIPGTIENFHLPDRLKHQIRDVDILSRLEVLNGRLDVITTDKAVIDKGIFDQCEFPGFDYQWLEYYDGVLSPKPVLEAALRKIVSN